MIELIPDRRYRFFTATGQYVGRFDGVSKGKAVFVDVIKIDFSAAEPVIVDAAGGIVDAEPWLQSLPFADTIYKDDAMEMAKRARDRKGVSIELAKPADIKRW